MTDIRLIVNGKPVTVPNRWSALSPDEYLRTVRLLVRFSDGSLSAGEVRLLLLCDLMGVNAMRLRDETAIANLLSVSERLTFLFRIVYSDDDAALEDLTPEERAEARRTDPFRLTFPAAKKLQSLDYRYVPDICWCKQMLPHLDGVDAPGYRVDTTYGTLTCSLTALQYIEARDLIGQSSDTLPLLASILYFQGPYDSDKAHRRAEHFRHLPETTLAAVSLNFQALNNFLYTRTPFSLLTKFAPRPDRPITTDAADALYDLCSDGLGNAEQVERMNVLTYLRILRKKTIDAVRNMRGMDMDVAKISTETGLPISVINEII